MKRLGFDTGAKVATLQTLPDLESFGQRASVSDCGVFSAALNVAATPSPLVFGKLT